MLKRNPGAKKSADDTSICIKRDPNYLSRCVEFLKQFARISGLQCNLERTAVIPIGGNYDTNDKLCPELSLSLEHNFTLTFSVFGQVPKWSIPPCAAIAEQTLGLILNLPLH